MDAKEIFSKKHLPIILGIITAILVIVVVALLMHQKGVFEPDEPQATVEEVDFSSVKDEKIRSNLETDKLTPGYYVYESTDGTYVLLTFGETLNLAMNVNPEISGMSVYFRVGFTPIAEENPHVEAHLYLTDAEAIGGDEAYLVFPGYGVGATGYNTGWCEATSDGNKYIVPLEETRILDRVATADPGVDMTNGFYYYEYEVTSTGVQIHSAKRLTSCPIWCKVRNIDEEANTCELLVGEELVVLNATFDPSALSSVKQMESSAEYKKVIMETVDGKPFMKLNAAATVPVPEEVPAT